MKKISLIIITVLCLSLVGCSNSAGGAVNVEWNSGEIKVNGGVMEVDRYSGDEAYYEDTNTETIFQFGWIETEDLTGVQYNSVGVLEEDMAKWKKAKYFQQFMGTEISMYYLADAKRNLYYAANARTVEGGMSVEQMCSNVYKILSECAFGTISQVKINDVLVLRAPDFTIEVRPDAVSIKGYIKVSQGTKPECTEQVTIGKKTLGYYNSGKYAYYQYGDLIIQTVVGVNLEEYFEFL